MTKFPHVAQVGAEQIPDCICGKGQTELDPMQHKAVCPFGAWLEAGNIPPSLPTEPVEEKPITTPMFHHCDCVAMMAQEADGFTREATDHPAGSRLNLLFLAQAEYLKQLAERVKVRQRFIGIIADVGKQE